MNHGNAVADAFAQSYFIGIFQLTAKSYAPGNGSNFYGTAVEFFARNGKKSGKALIISNE